MNNHPSKTAWRESTFCNGADACVEVAPLPDGNVAVRDSKDPAGPVLAVPGADWCAFLDRVKSWPAWPGGLVQAVRVRDGWWWMWLTSDATTRLQFTEAEMAAFWRGVHSHSIWARSRRAWMAAAKALARLWRVLGAVRSPRSFRPPFVSQGHLQPRETNKIT